MNTFLRTRQSVLHTSSIRTLGNRRTSCLCVQVEGVSLTVETFDIGFRIVNFDIDDFNRSQHLLPGYSPVDNFNRSQFLLPCP